LSANRKRDTYNCCGEDENAHHWKSLFRYQRGFLRQHRSRNCRDKSDEMTAAYRLRAMMLRDCRSDGIAKHKANYEN
jgi:hypothetical protein